MLLKGVKPFWTDDTEHLHSKLVFPFLVASSKISLYKGLLIFDLMFPVLMLRFLKKIYLFKRVMGGGGKQREREIFIP